MDINVGRECNPENMELFVTALESGEFTQGTGALERVLRDGPVVHCCLGVATRVAMANGVQLDTRTAYDGETTVFVDPDDPNGNSDSSFLPLKVAKWLGAELLGGTNLITDEGPYTPIVLNDSKGFTFPQIAVAFRRTYLPHTVTDTATDTDAGVDNG